MEIMALTTSVDAFAGDLECTIVDYAVQKAAETRCRLCSCGRRLRTTSMSEVQEKPPVVLKNPRRRAMPAEFPRKQGARGGESINGQSRVRTISIPPLVPRFASMKRGIEPRPSYCKGGISKPKTDGPQAGALLAMPGSSALPLRP